MWLAEVPLSPRAWPGWTGPGLEFLEMRLEQHLGFRELPQGRTSCPPASGFWLDPLHRSAPVQASRSRRREWDVGGKDPIWRGFACPPPCKGGSLMGASVWWVLVPRVVDEHPLQPHPAPAPALCVLLSARAGPGSARPGLRSHLEAVKGRVSLSEPRFRFLQNGTNHDPLLAGRSALRFRGVCCPQHNASMEQTPSKWELLTAVPFLHTVWWLACCWLPSCDPCPLLFSQLPRVEPCS